VSTDVVTEVVGVIMATTVEVGGTYERYAEQKATPLDLMYGTSEGQLTSPELVVLTPAALCWMV
jgi:hypothetical protein